MRFLKNRLVVAEIASKSAEEAFACMILGEQPGELQTITPTPELFDSKIAPKGLFTVYSLSG